MLKKITLKQMYIRIFLFLGMMSTLFIMLLSFFLAHRFSIYAKDEIDEFTKHRVNQIVTNAEFVLSNLRLYAFRMYEDKDVRKWIIADEDSPIKQTELINSLRQYLSTEPFIKSVYVVNFKTKRVIDLKTGIFDFEKFHDKRILKNIQENPPDFSRYFNHVAGNESYLAMIVPASPSRQKYEGYLVILLDKQMLQKHLFMINNDLNSEVLLLDSKGLSVLGNADGRLEMAAKYVTGRNIPDRFEWKDGKREWSVRYSELKQEGFVVYHFTPTDAWKGRISKFQFNIAVASLVIILAMLIVLYMNSSKNYKPFSEIVKLIQPISGTFETKSGMKIVPARDYEIIREGFESLLSKTKQMDSFIKTNSYILKEEYIRRWILNGIMTDPVKQYLKQESEILNYECIRIAVIRISKYAIFSDTYDFESVKLMKFAIGNICCETLANSGWICECIDSGSNHNIVLMAKSQSNSAHAEEALNEVKKQIDKWLKVTTVIAVSDDKNYYDELNSVYEMVYNLTTLNFISGENRVYTEKEADKIEPSIDDYNYNELLTQLVQSIRLRNQVAVKACLNDIMKLICGMTYGKCMHQLTHIIYVIMRAFPQMEAVQRLEDIKACLDRLSTLKEVQNWLESQIDEIIENLNTLRSSNRKERLAIEINEYVLSHIYDTGLTIDEVADNVSISVNYVRQVFKEVYDCSISDFIIEKRVNQAQKLLKATDWTISDIAEHSGFQTKSHFFTTFKKFTGKTPNQYRQEKE